MRFVQTALWVIALSLPPTLARARTGHCLLQVNGRTYLDGGCQITNQHDSGSFSVGAGGPRRSRYFAYSAGRSRRLQPALSELSLSCR